MAGANVNYGSVSPQTERFKMGRTNGLWNFGRNGINVLRLLEDSNLGDFSHEEFMSWVGGAVASHLGNYFGSNGGWHSQEGGATAGGITTLATDFPVGSAAGSVVGTPPQPFLAKGVIELATGAAAHNSVAMEAGGSANASAANGMYAVPSTATVTAPAAGQLPALFFEARIRFPQTTNTGIFIGLAAPGKTSAMNTVFNASDVAQKMNAIGFWITPVASTGFATSATKIQPGYCSSGGAFQIANQTLFTGSVGGIPSTTDYTSIVPAGVTLSPAALSTDWTKIGFAFDTNAQNACLRFYQDGVVLAQQTLAQIVAANWPSDVQLTPLVYVQSTGAGAATSLLDVDWIDVGMIVALE